MIDRQTDRKNILCIYTVLYISQIAAIISKSSIVCRNTDSSPRLCWPNPSPSRAGGCGGQGHGQSPRCPFLSTPRAEETEAELSTYVISGGYCARLSRKKEVRSFFPPCVSPAPHSSPSRHLLSPAGSQAYAGCQGHSIATPSRRAALAQVTESTL